MSAHERKVEDFNAHKGLTSDTTAGLFVDRSGNIWIGTVLGLDRFRTVSVVAEPDLKKVAAYGDILFGASNGDVYIGGGDALRMVSPGGRPRVLLDKVVTEALCEGRGGQVWAVLADRVVRFTNGTVRSIPRPPQTPTVEDCLVDANDTVWVNAIRGEISRLRQGVWQLFPPLAGPADLPQKLFKGSDGKVLLLLSSGLVGRIDAKDQLHVVGRFDLSDDAPVVDSGGPDPLFGVKGGLARLRNGQLRWLSSSARPWLRDPSGIVQTRSGGIWLIGDAGIVGMSAAQVERGFDDPNSEITPVILGFEDGLPSVKAYDGSVGAARGGDGRLWFTTVGGTVWIDPDRLVVDKDRRLR